MRALLLRTRNILLRPEQEWRVVGQERTSAGNLIKPYVLLMASLPPCAAVAERLLLGRTLAGRQPLTLVLATNVAWYLVIIVNMIIAAAVFTVIIRSSQRRLIDLQGFQLATYSFTPLFLASVITMAPGISWFHLCCHPVQLLSALCGHQGDDRRRAEDRCLARICILFDRRADRRKPQCRRIPG
jgi:hypothetical protein